MNRSVRDAELAGSPSIILNILLLQSKKKKNGLNKYLPLQKGTQMLNLLFMVLWIRMKVVASVWTLMSGTLQVMSSGFMGNCWLHGNNTMEETISRKKSHSISMYCDERITFMVSLGIPLTTSISFSTSCGSCLLVRLVKDRDHFYLNKPLNQESKSKYKDVIEHHFIVSIMDVYTLPSGNTFDFILWTYVTPSLQHHYDLEVISHPCPILAGEAHELLFCSDKLCHDSSIMIGSTLTFKDKYNPYYVIIYPRNTKYPIIQMKMVCSPHQVFFLQQPLGLDGYGFQLPFPLCNTSFFFLDSIDDHSTLFRYWMTEKEIMDSPLLPSYQGGIILTKHPLHQYDQTI